MRNLFCGLALEEELLEAIEESELLHADETGWKENGKTVWLWVLRTATVTFYIIGSRSWDVIASALENFAGWLMSDGYTQYRKYGKRLRCLAHIIYCSSYRYATQGTQSTSSSHIILRGAERLLGFTLSATCHSVIAESPLASVQKSVNLTVKRK